VTTPRCSLEDRTKQVRRGAVACLVYAYLLSAGLLVPTVTTRSTLTVVAAVLCGLQGGLFYTFSTAVMLALARQPHPSGMATMQTINVVVFNPLILIEAPPQHTPGML